MMYSTWATEWGDLKTMGINTAQPYILIKKLKNLLVYSVFITFFQ